MLGKRLIPVLLLNGDSLCKTTKFKNPKYIGDIINSVRIFNELEVDELLILDINCSRNGSPINFALLEQLAEECFMPLAYGGGIKDEKTATKIIELGFEKIVINSANFHSKELISDISSSIGSQSVVGVIDVKRTLFGKNVVCYNGTSKMHKIKPIDWALELESRGVGELLVTNTEREGTWTGLDLKLYKAILDAVSIPIIAHGGAGEIQHIKNAFDLGVNAVGTGNMVVFQEKGMGVLINKPIFEF